LSNPYTQPLRRSNGDIIPQYWDESEQEYVVSRGDQDGYYVKDQSAISAMNNIISIIQDSMEQGRHDPIVADILRSIESYLNDQPDVRQVHDELSYDELVRINDYLQDQLNTIYERLESIDTYLKERFEKTLWDEPITVRVVEE